MSFVINQDLSIGPNLKNLRLRNKLSQEDIKLYSCKSWDLR